MKRRLSVLLGGALVALAPHTGLAAPQPVPYLAPIISEVGTHTRRVEQVCTSTDETGQTLWSTNSYVEMGTGLGRFESGPNGAGEWVAAVAQFERTADGHVIGRRTQHQVILPPDLTTEPIDMLCPDGVTRLVSAPVSLVFLDRATGEGVAVAELQPCKPELLSDTLVIYRGALAGAGVVADLTYEIRLDRFEQSVVLRTKLPDPGQFQDSDGRPLDPRTTRVLMLTEFFGAPAPTWQTRTLKHEADPALRQVLSPPDLVDQELQFSPSMTLICGRTFLVGQEDAGVFTGKSFDKFGPREFVVESCDYSDLAPLLDGLEEVKSAGACGKYRTAKLERDAATLLPPARTAYAAASQRDPGQFLKEAQRSAERSPVRSASVAPQRAGNTGLTVGLVGKGVAIDYTVVNSSQTNYTFKSDVTYFISSSVNLYQTTTYEGACVIKLDSGGGASLIANGPVVFDSQPYAHVMLTGKDDNSVGETISGSSGDPTGTYYGNPALQIMTSGQKLKHLRVAHAQVGIKFHDFSAGTENTVHHAQMIRCATPFVVNGYGSTVQYFAVRNALITSASTAFSGYNFQGKIEHLTLDGCSAQLGYGSSGTNSLVLTNSLLVAVASDGNASVSKYYCASAPSAAGLWTTVGRGGHYLVPGSPHRDVGSPNITLATDIAQMSTYAPIELTGDFTTSSTLAPQAGRDADTPDRGYHYPPLDFLWTGLNVTNATLTLTNGVAIGFYGPKCVSLRTATSQFVSEGTPTRLNRLVRYQLVQEQWTAYGGTPVSVIERAGSGMPAIRLRFTDVSLPADAATRRNLVGGLWSGVNPLAVSDSQLRNVQLDAYGYAAGMKIAVTNTIVYRGKLSFYQEALPGYYPFTLDLYNNLFVKGSVSFSYKTNATTWTVKDNLFDPDTLSNSSTYSLAAGYNGYRSGLTSLGGSGNKTGLTMDYQSGPATNWFGVLGGYYYPTNGGNLSQLINAGSRSAPSASLYHYTVKADVPSVKATTNTVSIGYHYIAVDSNKLPNDFDGDLLADYFENRDGTGTYNSGDVANWQSWDSDGDGVGDYLEWVQGRNPTNAAHQVDSANTTVNLRIHTPLK